ncbi:hypothetical protein F3Y22_tig00110264pilonHSYRG00208 [Hibiscus syriacus]|uniref:Uncharacterized protein n=1 Tax=Hibiscus syriacus TaxID=106335 RepID=A0A6A3B4S6_HIBSY|nr:hypothetical protein F3Y22_tig00110264pilonHSYRG00208 [Hibiscus syriacus]
MDLVFRFDIFKKLKKHRGCVYTVSFNGDGNILASGADDKQIILWDWETGLPKLTSGSGHASVYYVFRAKIMPYTGDRSLITCASDGQVRHARISECGAETGLVAKHQGRANTLAVEPRNPHLVYTSGEDGLVQHVTCVSSHHNLSIHGILILLVRLFYDDLVIAELWSNFILLHFRLILKLQKLQHILNANREIVTASHPGRLRMMMTNDDDNDDDCLDVYNDIDDDRDCK